MNKKNIESVNNAILIQIEKGGFIPWIKDWASDFGKYSAVSKKPYSFLNSILLKHGGAYASFEQWKSRGFIPEKNTAEYVYFFKLYNPKTKEIVETEEEETEESKKIKLFPVLRAYRVFSAEVVKDQNGNAPEVVEKPEKLKPTNKEIFLIAQKYSHAENCQINFEKQDRAFYSPDFHSITLPYFEDFKSENGLFATLFHEIGHSTGKILGRKMSCFFGSPEYAQEELTAELTSAYICAELGIDNRDSLKNNAAYIQSWLQPLKNNLVNFYKATTDAAKAAKYILTTGGYNEQTNN